MPKRARAYFIVAAQQIIGPSSVLSLNVWMVGEGGNSDHCSDSGGSSTPEVEMRDSGFGMGVDEGEDVGIL